MNLFNAASQNNQNQEVRAFAEKTLPALKAHLEQARKLNGRVSGNR